MAPAIGLFLLAPFIGEFMLGNMAIDALYALPFIAPLYGGGALLIREAVRRTGRGWPSIAFLAVAYSIFEEGLVDQMFFNPAYDGLGMLEKAYIPALGTGAWVIMASVTVHAIWSICVSIAVGEALAAKRGRSPWLGNIGLTVVAAIFIAGSAYLAYTQYEEYRFLASATQLAATTLAMLALILGAFAIGRRPRAALPGSAPKPWALAALGFASSGALLLVIDYSSPWIAVALWAALGAAFIALIAWWSRRDDWTEMHSLALAGGALLTYCWVGVKQVPVLGSPGTIDLVGNCIFGVFAVGLLITAVRAVRKAGRL